MSSKKAPASRPISTIVPDDVVGPAPVHQQQMSSRSAPSTSRSCCGGGGGGGGGGNGGGGGSGSSNDADSSDAQAAAAISTTVPDDVPPRLNPHTALPAAVSGSLSQLQASLELQHIAHCDVFSGLGFCTPWGRLFGGEILAQAVVAASATVPDTHHVHSLHGYFILAGKNGVPVLFTVERTRTGRSFMTRAVNAQQENSTIFSLMISFHCREPGLEFEVRVGGVEVGGMVVVVMGGETESRLARAARVCATGSAWLGDGHHAYVPAPRLSPLFLLLFVNAECDCLSSCMESWFPRAVVPLV
jgi:hypothetical protein